MHPALRKGPHFYKPPPISLPAYGPVSGYFPAVINNASQQSRD